MTTQAIQYKKETISNDLKGLCVYEKPFVFRITEDNKQFYYSEIGIYVSCKFYKKEEFLNSKMCNKFVLDISHDYRSGDDLKKFGFVKNTGTYGKQFICKTIEEAINKTLEFLNSDFVDYHEFGTYGTKNRIEQKNIVSVREVAKSQCLHHYSSYERLYNSNDFTMKIIEASREIETLKKYIQTNENRHNSELKYRIKLSNKFSCIFDFDVKKCINQFKFDLFEFKKLAKLEDFKQLPENQKPIIKKLINYYKY